MSFRTAAEVGQKIQKVYDLSSYGYELTIPLIGNNVPTAMTPVLSSAQYQVELHPFNGTNYNPCLPHSVYMDTTEAACVANLGNNTTYNTNFTLHSHATGYIAHMAILAGFMDNVSAYTSGGVNLDSVTFTITTWLNSNTPYDREVIQAFPTVAFTPLAATGAQIFRVFEHLAPNRRLRCVDSMPITLNITVNETVTLTSTRQVGLMPAFPLYGNPANVAKPWTVPQVIMNIKPSIGSVDFIGGE